MIYFTETYFVPSQLYLGTLSAVHQKKPLMYIDYMSGWKSIRSGQG